MAVKDIVGIKDKSFKFLVDNFDNYIRILRDLIRYKSVASWADNELSDCANYISDILKVRGFKVDLKNGGGAPVVFAEVGSGSRTVLIYNHYDVQPPDPLELWGSDPFELVVKEDYLLGRGVADNKGNIVARIAAIDSLIDYLDDLNLRVKFLIEGEEEVGSPTLDKVIKENLDWVRADGGLWESAYVGVDDRLEIPLGLKGMLYVEVMIRGANRDVHSGLAPLIPNPAWRLAKLLTYLKSEDGVILVPGIYEGVDPEFISYSEELLRNLDCSELVTLRRELSIKEFVRGLECLEAFKELYTKPSLNISGLYSGYVGKGVKTIVPSIAGVKIDIRLVPGQNPADILKKFKEYLSTLGYSDVELLVHSVYPAGYTKPNEAIVKISVEAAAEVYGKYPKVLPLASGSGPIYLFTNIAKIPITGAGVGYYNSRVHSPNENIRRKDFLNSMKHVALTLVKFSTI